MLASMAATAPKRPSVAPSSPGAAIKARRTYLGLTADDVVELTGGVINLRLLTRLENDHVSPSTLRVGKYRALLAVLKWTPSEFEEAEMEADFPDHLYLDPSLPGLRNRRESDLVALRVNGDSMVSERAGMTIRPGSHVIVEMGAIPSSGDIVAAWLPQRDLAVIKEYKEGPDSVLRSLNPAGPVFRLGIEPIEIRGVVRAVIAYP